MKPIFLLTTLLGAGCLATQTPEEPPPHRGVRLSVACPPGAAELVRARSRGWAARQQAEVVAVASADAADVVVAPPADLPRQAAAKELISLEMLKERGRGFDWPGLLPEYREQLALWDGTPYAVPIAGEGPVCVYRADLYAANQADYRAWLSKHGKPARDLAAPQTWDDFADQAAFFRQHLNKPSLPPLPADDAAVDRLFYSVAAPYVRRAVPVDEPKGPQHLDEVFSFHFDQKTGAPRLDADGFREALELLVRLQACRPAGTSAGPEAAFAAGDAVLCLTDVSALAAMQALPALRDRFGVCPVPAADRRFGTRKVTQNRVPYLGGAGWLAAVSAKSPRREAALDLLEELAGPGGSRQTALEPRWGGPTRAEHLSRQRWDSFDLDPARTTALRDALNRALLGHGIKNPVLVLRTPEQNSYRAALVAGVRSALAGERKPAEALAAAQQEWKELILKRGPAAHLRDYRLSLRLLGR